MNLATISKAIAGGIASAIVGVLARYGFNANDEQANAIGVVVTAVVSYAAGHILVYVSPKNKGTK